MISLIAGMDRNRNIGLNNDMPWGKTMPSDLKRFKELTTDKVVVMGRKTFESLPAPLPNRWHLILTSQNIQLPEGFYGRTISHFNGLLSALMASEEEHFIIGGAEIYKQFMPYADKIYLTKVLANLEGDTQFPSIVGNWKIDKEPIVHHVGDQFPSQYITYEKLREEEEE